MPEPTTDHDPQFPGRPQTLDFERISAVLHHLDARAERGEKIDAIIESVVDVKSLAYLTQHRIARTLTGGNVTLAFLLSMYMDGFMAGALFEQEGGHRTDDIKEGGEDR